MSRRSKGPRLWLRPARGQRAASWLILDGTSQRGTGCGPSDVAGAERALSAYLTEKHTGQPAPGGTALIDDVLALYIRDIVPHHARPAETGMRIRALRAFWGGRSLSEVSGAMCRAYAAGRSTPAAARRELEELRAAINHHRREGLTDRVVSVALPPRQPARERWLTRDEAAGLIRTAWRAPAWRHVARFMVVARYMGSRAAVICSASLEPRRPAGRAWVDLTTGVFYGRPIGQRETKKRRQTVRVPMALLAHLRRWRAAGARYVVEWRGEPVQRIDKAHREAVAAAGLALSGPNKVTPHTWRHSLATWLMQAGAEPGDVAEYLGMSEEVLLRVYRHHRPDAEARVHGLL